MSSFDFMNNPVVPGQQNAQPQPLINPELQNNYYEPTIVNHPQNNMNNRMIEPDQTILAGGYGFTIIDDNKPMQDKHVLSVPVDIPDTSTRRRGGRRKKDELEEVNSTDIVRVEGTVEENPTIYNYMQTTNMLRETLEQIDCVASDMKEELDSARLNRTMKNKQNYIVGLGGNLVSLLNARATVIREINNAISKSVELDYRKEKDRKAAEGAANDDKYIMDLYTSFIRNPMGQDNSLAPNAIDTAVSSINGSGIIRSPLQSTQPADGQPMDIGYLNYLNRLTPEQNMMFYEQDPNVKTVVVFDASTGNKFFQVMNVATGQVIPNVPVLDNRFMEDTYIDVKNKVATNNNLHESYPVIVINDNVTKEY